MLRDRLADSLVNLGIEPDDCCVLKLLPVVHTAWQNGSMEPVAAQRIEAMARIEFELSVQGMRVLERWLGTPPACGYVVEGLRDLYAMSLAVDELDVDASELPMLMAHAEAIARTSSRGMDRPESMVPHEELALHEIAELLHVDHGETWGELERELGEDTEPVTLRWAAPVWH